MRRVATQKLGPIADALEANSVASKTFGESFLPAWTVSDEQHMRFGVLEETVDPCHRFSCPCIDR